MPASSGADAKTVPIKREGGSDRIRFLEEETKSMKTDIKKFLSIITIQTEQLARQEKMLNEVRDDLNSKANHRATICWIMLLIVIFLLMGAMLMGVPTLITEDTALYLNVKATPANAPFITAGVKVRFTMGDLASCVKGAFSGDTIDLSLS
eukprot:CAMPEP_0181103400 /NCGR_PEP_ID=MMETSP1071-20121207/14844_1 /TAXON_ID=35127 /ORGANISM="Thalassiosira sp., Strain NH16" /LENGTH=150 /DNA_ID=CAMNT_0023186469 /DNA_START=231 /DNA_END=683 /DNA_ORIENTATION=-